MFKNPSINIFNAQLIFNTHNPIYINNNLFRRDEIYIVDKNKEGISELYNLTVFDKLRSDKNYMKEYLSGAYGGIGNCELEDVIKDIIKQGDVYNFAKKQAKNQTNI